MLNRFQLDPGQKASHLSKGQKTQLALIGAICPEPELLVLDEPTFGLDPIVRREFIETVIGAYQEGDPGRRTVFVSTHLISEFEGLIDEFTIIDRGRAAHRQHHRDGLVRVRGDRCGPRVHLDVRVAGRVDHLRRRARLPRGCCSSGSRPSKATPDLQWPRWLRGDSALTAARRVPAAWFSRWFSTRVEEFQSP